MKNQYIEPGYLKLSGLARYSGLSHHTLKDFIRDGLPYFQKAGIGNGRAGGILVRKSDFDLYMENFRRNKDPRRIADELLR